MCHTHPKVVESVVGVATSTCIGVRWSVALIAIPIRSELGRSCGHIRGVSIVEDLGLRGGQIQLGTARTQS